MSAPYRPPATTAAGIEIALEPARFARTGAGMLQSRSVRDEDGFYGDAMAYSLDAPEAIPSGSVEGTFHDLKAWNAASVVPPWHYLGTSVRRERA